MKPELSPAEDEGPKLDADVNALFGKPTEKKPEDKPDASVQAEAEETRAATAQLIEGA